LRGSSDFYRIRVGDYRIGVAVEGDEVEFVRCLHRRDIYGYFPYRFGLSYYAGAHAATRIATSLMEIPHTDRLIAERLRAEHFVELRRMHRDRRVMATLAPAGAPNGGVLSDEETRQFLRRHLDHWERHGYGLWVFRDRADGHFVGRAGLHSTNAGGKEEVELAYALMAEYWGRGLATEVAEGILAVAFGRLHMTEVVCFTLTTNRASQRVMEKVGFEYERDFVHAGLPHVFYRITASGWKGRGGDLRSSDT
jgi:ribosomal-protein-alanine N-acetyltransferase